MNFLRRLTGRGSNPDNGPAEPRETVSRRIASESVTLLANSTDQQPLVTYEGDNVMPPLKEFKPGTIIRIELADNNYDDFPAQKYKWIVIGSNDENGCDIFLLNNSKLNTEKYYLRPATLEGLAKGDIALGFKLLFVRTASSQLEIPVRYGYGYFLQFDEADGKFHSRDNVKDEVSQKDWLSKIQVMSGGATQKVKRPQSTPAQKPSAALGGSLKPRSI